MKIRDVLTPDEIKNLCKRSAWRGLCDVALTWGIILGMLVLAGLHPAWYTILPALVLIGGRQLALAILMHEASHRALSSRRSLNDFVGDWMCAAPMWLTLARYRDHHIRHHSHTASDKDPDLGLVEPFPAPASSLARKVLRDLTGVSGLRRVIGLLLMDIGVLSYTAANGAKPISPRPSITQMLCGALRYTGPMLFTNVLLCGGLFAAGIGWTYALWVVAWLTTFSLFARIRSAAEHACVPQVNDPFQNTRTVRANIFARLTVAPHHVNYHLEHHLLMTMPHYNLPRLHRMLRERGIFEHAPYAGGYAEVIRLITQAHTEHTPREAGA